MEQLVEVPAPSSRYCVVTQTVAEVVPLLWGPGALLVVVGYATHPVEPPRGSHRQPRAVYKYWARLRRVRLRPPVVDAPVILSDKLLQSKSYMILKVPLFQFFDRVRTFRCVAETKTVEIPQVLLLHNLVVLSFRSRQCRDSTGSALGQGRVHARCCPCVASTSCVSLRRLGGFHTFITHYFSCASVPVGFG